MFRTSTKIRVRYSETDQMGYVYYGNYTQYFEVARVEALRTLGVRYKELEDRGIWLPVVNLQINYQKPAGYDEELEIITMISKMPGARISFDYECLNENAEKVCTGSTDLVFLDADRGRPMRCPDDVAEAFRPYFEEG